MELVFDKRNTKSNTMSVSIICPTYNEEPFIDSCIQSVLAQDIPFDQWELLIVDGGSTDQTRKLIEPYQKQYPNIRLLDNPKRTVPYAMNIGIRAAKGEYICRIDAHADYPMNYISTLLGYINSLSDAVNVGAACITRPRSESNKARAIAAVLSDKFGVGGSAFRLGVSKVTETDTVPFGFFRREVFERVGLYDERLTRNQDIELNKRIKQYGGKIYLVPDVTCTYYARDTYSALAHNNYANGKWNILTVYYTKSFRSLGLRHFIPLLFVISLITGVTIPIYLLLMSVIALRLSIQKDLLFGYVLWAYVVLHISYGVGSLVGLLQLPFRKR